jgi:hypothetical protein
VQPSERGVHVRHDPRTALEIVGWFRVSSKGLSYRGRLSKQPFSAWARTPEGTAAIAERAKRDQLRVFGRTRARRRMWRELETVAREESFRDAMLSNAKHFATAIIEASHAPGLPRRTIALHRLVVVPRTLVAGRMRSILRRRLSREGMATLDPHVREFFLEQLVVELDAAIAAHRPGTSRPVVTHEAWACVGHYAEYEWVDPMFSGPGWGGHLLMFEFPAQGLARKARKELDQAARDIQASLANISRTQRQALIQMAVDGLSRATA